MKKPLFLLLALCIVAVLSFGCAEKNETPAPAADRADSALAWQYKTPDEVKTMLDSGTDAIYLDIRQAESYNAGYLPGSLSVKAFPVDTPELEDTLRPAVSQLTGDEPIIVICEGGKKGAMRTISVLVEEGLPLERFYILEGGVTGWPYPEMMVTEDGIEPKPAETAVEAVAKDKVFVGTDWLNSLIAGEQPQSANYVLIEASWGEAGDEYKTAHIPGAVHLNTDLIEEDVYWNIRTPQEIEQVLTDFGINKDTVVVVYGNDSGAARLAFVCLWAGVEEVHLLDGGYPAWLAAGYATETGILQPTPVTAFGATVPAHPEYVITWPQEVIAAQEDSNFRLVSIRSWEEFIGETSGYSYIDRAGEPQGAVWGHDEGDYYQADGTIKSLEEVQASLWAEWDITKANDIAFYCGTGWRACIPFLLCYENGWRNVQLYDGGWFVWQMDESLPVQTGDPR